MDPLACPVLPLSAPRRRVPGATPPAARDRPADPPADPAKQALLPLNPARPRATRGEKINHIRGTSTGHNTPHSHVSECGESDSGSLT